MATTSAPPASLDATAAAALDATFADDPSIPGEHELSSTVAEVVDEGGSSNPFRSTIRGLESASAVRTTVLPGVDRSALKSLWTPNVRWKEVTE